jgi:hypothetical protein
VVAAVSAALIFLYNVYSKAFDAAQIQAGGYVATAVKLKQTAINNSAQGFGKIQFAYSRGIHDISTQDSEAIDALAIEIRNDAILLGGRLQKTTASSEQLADALTQAATVFALPDSITKTALAEAGSKIARLQQDVLTNYDKDISALATSEFKTFYTGFEAQLPAFLQPQRLIVIVILILSLGTYIIWKLLSSEAPTDNSG